MLVGNACADCYSLTFACVATEIQVPWNVEHKIADDSSAILDGAARPGRASAAPYIDRSSDQCRCRESLLKRPKYCRAMIYLVQESELSGVLRSYEEARIESLCSNANDRDALQIANNRQTLIIRPMG
jgi:hypothetical protein